MPNLVKICSIFLKLYAVKQSGPGFFGLPGMLTCIDTDTDIGTVILFLNFILLVLQFCAFIICKTMRLTVMISNETTYLLT